MKKWMKKERKNLTGRANVSKEICPENIGPGPFGKERVMQSSLQELGRHCKPYSALQMPRLRPKRV